MGYINAQSEPDEQLIWSPKGNPSLQALDRKKELFGASSNVRTTHLIITAKEIPDESPNSKTDKSRQKNLLTL